MGVVSLAVVIVVLGGALFALARWDRLVRRRGSTLRSGGDMSKSEAEVHRNWRAEQTMVVNPDPDWDKPDERR
jgi:hypothetical protein